MTEENRHENIALEMDRGERELAVAGLAREAGSPDIAVARAYYAALHFARSLLLADGLEARTHAGVVHLVHAHFVRPGRLAPEVARNLSLLEAQRQSSDYDVSVVFTESMACDAEALASELAGAVRTLLQSEGYL